MKQPSFKQMLLSQMAAQLPKEFSQIDFNVLLESQVRSEATKTKKC